MKAAIRISVFLNLALLNCCMQMQESDPSVIGSSVRIAVAQRGDLQLATSLLKDAIYIEKPSLCACTPNTEENLFVLDADGRSATQVKAHFGQSAGNFVVVQSGLKAGDKVIVNDMAAYHEYRRIKLR